MSDPASTKKIKVWMVTFEGDEEQAFFYSYDPSIYVGGRMATVQLGTFVPDDLPAMKSPHPPGQIIAYIARKYPNA